MFGYKEAWLVHIVPEQSDALQVHYQTESLNITLRHTYDAWQSNNDCVSDFYLCPSFKC